MALKRPGIPAISTNIPTDLQAVLGPMKENIEISMGLRSSGKQVGSGIGFDGWKRRSATLEMLVKAGLITEAQAIDLYNTVS